MRKNYLIIIGVTVVSVFLILRGCSSENHFNGEEYLDYFTELYSILKDEEFFKADIEDDVIILYDNNFNQIRSIAFHNNRKNIKLLYILNEETRMLFVVSQSVDDTAGIVFFHNTANANLDGFWALDRVSGNGFIYSTSAP